MEDDNTPNDGAKLTKNQKKKLKEKAKKEAAKAAEAAGGAPKEESKDAPAPAKGGVKGKAKGKGKGKKGESAAAKLIKQKLQEKKQIQEEIEQEEAEIRRKAAEERKKREEEERKEKEEAELIEKERLAHIRDLKKRGLYLSKKEQAKKDARDDARRQLIEQGLIDASELENKEDASKPKIVYTSKKRKRRGKKQQEDNKQEENKDDNAGENDDDEEEDATPKQSTEDTKLQEESNAVETKHNVQPGLEETKHDLRKPVTEEPVKEIDDALKVDDWEDFLDDDVANKQVKLQEEIVKNPEAKPEELTTTADVKEDGKDGDNTKDKPHPHEEEKVNKANTKKAKSGKNASGATGATGAASIFERSNVSKKHRSKKKKGKAEEEEIKEEEGEKLRCPIVCVLGHVDTGKTLLLDKIRKTNVQRGEAGGITQQIGATYFPGEALQGNIDKLGEDFDTKEVEIPGLLVIDTPGHESFTNLRSRGSNLCDLAVLVVDIMHGLEQQTLESIDLLRKRRTPFIVALNKIDVVHSWEKIEYRSSKEALSKQDSRVVDEYEDRRNKAFLQFNENSLNIIEYWKNDDPKTYISAVPTSAMTGEGIPDILGMIVKSCQKNLRKKIIQKNTEFQCTVLEVKKISGVGTTVDVVLVNGRLKVGDTIVLAGFNGPIVTRIRALLTPHPMKEIRVKGDYLHHEELYGSMGIKISAPELDYALAGGELYRAENEDHVEELCEEISENMFNFAEKYVNPKEQGVCVQASTLGSLEALLEFLKQMNIPVCSVNIGELYKKDVMKALKAITGENVKKEYATILAFDVKVDEEAKDYAEENGIRIFQADIIYHLFDMFTEYVEQCVNDRKITSGAKAVFPCVLEIMTNNIFHKTNPILLGCNVKAGVLRVGTPICVPDRGMIKIGVVSGIQKGGHDVTKAREIDGGVSVRIQNEKHISAEKHFTEDNQLVSIITRDSIEALKTFFKDEMTKDDWKLIIRLKKVFDIV